MVPRTVALFGSPRIIQITAFWPNGNNVGLNPLDFGVYIQDKIEFEGNDRECGPEGRAFLPEYLY